MQPVPVLPKDPWTERTADAFWDQLQDEMLHEAMETELVEAEAERRPKPRCHDFLDHEDWRQEPKTREKRRTEMDKHRQAARDLTQRQSMEAEKPSWSSIVKPILPKILRTDEYGQCGSHIEFSNHGGDRTVRENFEIFENERTDFSVQDREQM